MKYVHYYEHESAYTEDRSSHYLEPWVGYTKEGESVSYNKTEEEKLRGTPLTFEITSDGSIRWKAQNTGYTRAIEYKKNDGAWTRITSATGASAPTISVAAGDTVQFRGNNYSVSVDSAFYNSFSGTTCGFNLKGNIMSLINSTDFANLTTLQSEYTFAWLFRNCTGLTDASKLVLPATTLAEYCYYMLFCICTSLSALPELPATTLARSCYQSMFQDCTNLTTAPELPATTLANYCYESMFAGCSSITTAPELPSTTLEVGCYEYMFSGCTSLTTAPALSATTLADHCYHGMFEGCTSLTTAPALPATTLANHCYNYMFQGCTSLNYIKCLATDISASYCTSSWLFGVASSGTFVKNSSMSSWTTGSSGIPSNWTVQNA